MSLWDEIRYKLAIVRTLLPERPWTAGLRRWAGARGEALRAWIGRVGDRTHARWPSTRSMRRWLQRHGTLVTASVVGLLAIAMGLAAMQLRPMGSGVPARSVYYWDLETEQPFRGSDRELPPIEAPSGGIGARAHLFTCGQCAPDEWFGFLERYTAEAKRAQLEGIDGMGPLDPRLADLVAENHLVRALDGEEWVTMSSDEGAAVRSVVGERCESREQRRRCRPGDR